MFAFAMKAREKIRHMLSTSAFGQTRTRDEEYEMKNFFTRHGIGPSATTHSPVPVFGSTTTTPEVKNKTQVGAKDADPALPTSRKYLFFKNKVAPAPGKYHGGSAAMQVKLGSAKSKDFTSAFDPDRYAVDILNDRYFPDLQGADKKNRLEAVLCQAKNRLAMHATRHDVPAGLEGAEMVLLAQALGSVSRHLPNGTDDAARALACLQNIDLLGSIRQPDNCTPAALNGRADRISLPEGYGQAGSVAPHASARFDQADIENAWHLAQVLGRDGVGFKLLKKLARAEGAPAGSHASVSRHDDAMLHVYLDATREREKTKAKGAGQYAPSSVYAELVARAQTAATPGTAPPEGFWGRNGAEVPGALSLLDKGLLALKDHLDLSHAHAVDATRSASEFALHNDRKNGNTWAIGAIRNGIYTDAAEDEKGKPTAFALINGRMNKLTGFVESATTPPASRFKKFAKKYLLPQKGKNPLDAYNDLGNGDSAIGFKNSEQMGGIKEGRLVKEVLIGNVKRALLQSGGMTAGVPSALLTGIVPDPANPATQPEMHALRNLVRLAILEQTEASTTMLPRFKDGDALTPIELKAVRKRVYDHLASPNAHPGVQNGGLDATRLEQLEILLNLENKGYLPQRLMEIASEFGGPANVDAATALAVPEAPPAAPAAGAPDWQAFGAAIDRVVNSTLVNAETPKLGTQTSAQVAERFRTAIKNQELGSRFKFENGGLTGAKTGGLTEALTGILTLGTLRGKVDLRGSRARVAVFEVGTGTAGNELIIATQTNQRGQVGGGTSIGPGKVSKKLSEGTTIGAAVGDEANYAYEHQKQRGVAIRFRRLYTGVGGDVANNAKLGRLTTKIMNPTSDGADGAGWCDPASANDRASILKRVLQEWDDVSVSWLGVTDGTHSIANTSTQGAGVSFEGIRGVVAGLSQMAELKRSNQTWGEQGGSLHVEKSSKTTAFKLNLGISGPGIGGLLDHHAFSDTVEGDMALSGIDLGLLSADMYRTSVTQRDTHIEEDGEFSQRTFRTETYANAAQILARVVGELDRIAVDKAKKYAGSRYGAGGPTNANSIEAHEEHFTARETALKGEYEKLKQFIKQQQDDPKLSRSYQVYLEPKKEVVDAVNYYKGLKHGADVAGDAKAATQCQKRIDKILRDDNSWEYCFMIDVNTQSKTTTPGLNYVVQNHRINKATFTNIHDFT
ncbi:hypothetical protein D3870_21015 [Noviherbaspirillum cavernae]|uniref:Uncharacterized protein n=2 Tax=Noviherbaspirillum cavernae TaxID=2320862 RepID=A0A418WVY8_9BURK|nr:hypothetical protein D3870_21015 [Noviherbaspirillum cavernae]